MCSRASRPSTVSTTRPRTSAQSQGSSAEWMSTVIRGSLRTFFARWRTGSVLTSTNSPSLSTHVGSACGCPSGISVTTVARFFVRARRTASSSSGIAYLLVGQASDSAIIASPRRRGGRGPAGCSPGRLGLPTAAGSVAEDRDDDRPGDRVESEVEARDSGGHVGVNAELVRVDRVNGEQVAVRRIAGRRGGAAEILGPVVVAYRECPGRETAPAGAACAGRQLRHIRRNVGDHPVPEAGPRRGVWVVAGHGEAPGLSGESVPAKVRRYVLPAHAEAVVHLVITEGSVVADVVALHCERWHFRQEVIRQRCPLRHRFLLGWKPAWPCPRYSGPRAPRRHPRHPRHAGHPRQVSVSRLAGRNPGQRPSTVRVSAAAQCPARHDAGHRDSGHAGPADLLVQQGRARPRRRDLDPRQPDSTALGRFVGAYLVGALGGGTGAAFVFPAARLLASGLLMLLVRWPVLPARRNSSRRR